MYTHIHTIQHTHIRARTHTHTYTHTHTRTITHKHTHTPTTHTATHTHLHTPVSTHIIHIVLVVGRADVAVRLIGGPNDNEGRIEAYFGGEWGTVCDTGFGATEAAVACFSLGFE